MLAKDTNLVSKEKKVQERKGKNGRTSLDTGFGQGERPRSDSVENWKIRNGEGEGARKGSQELGKGKEP